MTKKREEKRRIRVNKLDENSVLCCFLFYIHNRSKEQVNRKHHLHYHRSFFRRFRLALWWSGWSTWRSQRSTTIQTTVLIFRFFLTWFQDLRTKIRLNNKETIFLLETNTSVTRPRTSFHLHCRILHNS